jgi:hypothetical protein
MVCTITMHGNQHFILLYLINQIRQNLCIAYGVARHLNGTYFKGFSINTDVDFSPLPTIFGAMLFRTDMTTLRRFYRGKSHWNHALSNLNGRVAASFLQSLLFGVAGD